MTVREQVALSDYTTLRLGGPAARFTEAGTDEEVVAAVRDADQRGEPVLVLGGGSNLVVADEGFAGTVVWIRTRGVRQQADGPRCALAVAAGEDWDLLVRRCISDGLSGLECLSGIPGLAGATPIQNVGAYGQEVAQVISAVRVYDRSRQLVTSLPASECGFGYRTSAFKRAAAGQPTGRFVVLGVSYLLSRDPLSAPLRYRELARALEVSEGARVPLAAAREAVLTLRRGKGMVADPADPESRSAGSFFTNPVLDAAQFAALRAAVARQYGPDTAIPQYPAPEGQVKVSAAWLIERAGFGKGYPGSGERAGQGGARTGQGGGHAGPAGPGGTGPRISAKHTLALVNPGGASTKGLLELAAEISDGVRARFGVELVREPVLVAP
ncbi:MAG TPA: UDP-N-acetylmuramate dehydrogenase [Streptosporangiaceae bacterium]